MSEEPEPEITPLGQIVLDVRAWIAEADGWNELYDDFAGEFFDTLKHVLGDDLEEQLEMVDEVVTFYAETACLEFFLAFRDEEFPSPIEAFLKERGEGLSDEQREFLTQLQNSNFSLYEVTEAVEDSHIVIKDLVMAENEPVRVEDDGTGMDFEVGETLGGRVIQIGGKPTLTAIAFGIGDESRKDILEYFEESVKDILKEEVKLLRKDPRTVRRARTQALQFLPPITTAHWVGDRFDEADDSPFPQVQLITVTYAEGPTEEQMRARLEDDPRFDKNPQREGEYVLMQDDQPVAMVRWQEGLQGIVGHRDGVDILDAALRARFGPALGAPTVSEMSLEDAMAQVEALDQEGPGTA